MLRTSVAPFLRAALAFLLLPGLVAFVVPLLIVTPASSRFTMWSGTPLLAAGIFLLLWCVRDFYVEGKGTLAPWSPPQHLVVSGLYRVSRNPMYVAVILILSGWAVGFRSRTLTIYAVLVAIAFHLRVVFGEEPWLARRYGDQWERYRASVPRWLGRYRPVPQSPTSR
jgi:protein-S-isoprenylcysteine O-methyltransferase Ste14